ncbi:hypothetical protein JW916_09360 [Candidatus Sumerlaeota bacterium]|nr:hypothetical protein [Candidatus Sumerlaeota bacterium]
MDETDRARQPLRTGASRPFLKRGLAKIARTVLREQWMLLYRFSDEVSYDHTEFARLIPPRGEFWADPFVVYRDGTYYLFFEEFRFRQGRGRIFVAEIDEGGLRGQPRLALERPYHLSYPFVFRWQDRDFMIPETIEAGVIEVYECVGFPTEWRRLKTLVADIQAVDTTLVEHEGRWWMFANAATNPGDKPYTDLYLFHADDPLTDRWTPHPMNPVVSDIRGSRPGGNVIRTEEGLVRVAHDCGDDARRGVRFKKILTLDERRYAEEEVRSLGPAKGDGLVRIHTFNRENRMTVIDGLRRIPKWPMG